MTCLPEARIVCLIVFATNVVKTNHKGIGYGVDMSALCFHRLGKSALIEVRGSTGDFVHRQFGLRLVSIVRLGHPASAFDDAVLVLLLETDGGYAI